MDVKLLIAVTSGVAIANSIFFAVYLLKFKKNKRSNLLLALLLLALALRISKSVIIIIWPNSSAVFPALGLFGMGAIGPLLWLYLHSLASPGFRFRKADMVHFIPSGLILIALPFSDDMMIYRFYQLIAIQISIYIAQSFRMYYSQNAQENTSPVIASWSRSVTVGTTIIWMSFLAQLVFDYFVIYLGVTAVAAGTLYVLAFKAMRQSSVLAGPKRQVQKSELSHLSTKIRELLEEKKLYKEQGLTISRIAKELNSQSYLVSQAINESYGQTLPELLNKYRVEEAGKLLNSPSHQHYSIEAIANECGFNAMSAFYTAFKKNKGLTPSEFKRKIIA